MYKLLLKLILLFCGNFLFCQSIFLDTIKLDLYKLDNTIYNIFTYSNCYHDSIPVKTLHVFFVKYDTLLRKSDFIDLSFLNKIQPMYVTTKFSSKRKILYKNKHRKVKYLDFPISKDSYLMTLNTYLYSKNNNRIIASLSTFIQPWILFCNISVSKSTEDIEQPVVNFILTLKEPYMFHIESTTNATTFIVDKQKNIYVTDFLEIWDLKYFIDNKWEEFISNH